MRTRRCAQGRRNLKNRGEWYAPKRAFCFVMVSLLAALGLTSTALADDIPTYPDLQPFYITSNKFDTYRHANSARLMPYLNPDFRSIEHIGEEFIESDLIQMTGKEGYFRLTGETGPNGTVDGNFYYQAEAVVKSSVERVIGANPDGSMNKEILEFTDTYQIEAEGLVTSGKAAFDRFGILQIKGSPDYQKQFQTSGTVKITLTYNVHYFDEATRDYAQARGTKTSTRPLAFLSCISDLSKVNYCNFETGDRYGDYDFQMDFLVDGCFDNYYWARILEYEFELIKAGAPAPAAQAQPGVEKEEEEKPEQEEQADQPQDEWGGSDEGYLEEPVLAQAMQDNPNAGFSLTLGCSNNIYPEDGIDCSAMITQGEENTVYEGSEFLMEWIVDGYLVKTGSVILGSDALSFSNPPPGSHYIEVRAHSMGSGLSRVSGTHAEVLVPPEIGQISPGAQAGAAAGSMLVLSAWLWAEWAAARERSNWARRMAEAAEERLSAFRQRWFERQMDRSSEERTARRAREHDQAQDQAWCERQHRKFRDKLLEIAGRYPAEEDRRAVYDDMIGWYEPSISFVSACEERVELYDDMIGNVCRNGIWDREELQRLQEGITECLISDRMFDSYSQWQREIDFLNRRQKEWSEVMGSWSAWGSELIASIATSGASNLVFMPARAIGNALYGRRRAQLYGESGWEAAKTVMWSSVPQLTIEGAVGMLFEAGAKRISRLISTPKPKPSLPVIHQRWGRGPQVFVNQPIYKPGPIPPVDLGMDNYLNNHIRPLSNELADNMARLYRNGVDIDPHMNNVLRPGERFEITRSDRIAVQILNNPAYKQAVRAGHVPASAQRFINITRDKICKNAIAETFERLSKLDLYGRPASDWIQSVAVTGTGARPMSSGAINRFTDFDSTAIGGRTDWTALDSQPIPNREEIERVAEDWFADTWRQVVRESGLDAHVAEANMFSGIHVDTANPPVGGYASAPLIHWHQNDLINRGRSAVRLADGGVMFNAHPDVAPMAGFGQLDVVPRFPRDPVGAAADAGRVLLEHVEENVALLGRNMTWDEVVNQESKHLFRWWKSVNAGSGQPIPPLIQRIVDVKNKPGTRLSSREIREIVDLLVETFPTVPRDLGGKL